MDEQKLNRRRILGGVVATIGAAGALAQLGPGSARAAEAVPPADPAIPDQGAAQAPTIKDVKDKVAYITGGSSGIGLGIARALHEKGAKVVLGNLDDRQFADALKMFPANDARVATVVHNVMERDSWEAKADEIEKKFGPVDILVNNAGVGVSAGALDGTYNDWDWLMGVNLWGPIYGCKTFVARMRARPASGCHIVTTTSTSGVLVGMPNGIYAVTKIAATGLMEQLRVDLRATNIGTSALIPGVTQTNISQSESHRPEALRNPTPYAPRAAGRPRAADAPPPAFWDRPQDPLTVGRLTVDGILNNDLFICPAPEYRQGVEARGYAMSESMVSFVPAPQNIQAGIAANRYLFTPIYAQEVTHRRATRKRTIQGV
jgi:NAD(P)-dependent dehydrogenase (short-subunit alcohol dehydrogenase family)